MIIDGVKIKSVGLDNFSEDEAKKYIAYVRERISEPLKSIEVRMCEDGKVDVEYNAQGEKFERIRRITGYLVGTTDRWNDAKKSEEHERVKHSVPA